MESWPTLTFQESTPLFCLSSWHSQILFEHHVIMCFCFSMKLDLVNGIGSLTDFARNTRAQVEELQKTKQPRVLTQNGKAAAVVLSVEAYEEMAQLAYEREMDIRLSKALDAYALGERGKDSDQVFERFRKQL